MTKQEWCEGKGWQILAFWPNSRTDPLEVYVETGTMAIITVITLAFTHEHTNIYARDPWGMELIRMWGDPK